MLILFASTQVLLALGDLSILLIEGSSRADNMIFPVAPLLFIWVAGSLPLQAVLAARNVAKLNEVRLSISKCCILISLFMTGSVMHNHMSRRQCDPLVVVHLYLRQSNISFGNVADPHCERCLVLVAVLQAKKFVPQASRV